MNDKVKESGRDATNGRATSAPGNPTRPRGISMDAGSRNTRREGSSPNGVSPVATASYPIGRDGKSPDSTNSSSEAWTTNRTLSLDEKKMTDSQDTLKSKKAAFAMSPPKVQNIESRQVMVEWDASKLEDAEYHLEMAAGPSSDFKEIYSGNKLEFAVENLSPGCSYSFRCFASSKDFTGDSSPLATVSTKAAVPDTPSAPRLAKRDRNTLSVKWPASGDNGAPITAYVLEWDQGKKGSAFTELYTGKERTFKVPEKLQPGHAYSFRLRVVNEVGESESSQPGIQYTSAGVPGQPNAPCLVRRTSTTISVSWIEPENNGACITEYKLEMESPKSGYGFQSAYSGDAKEYVCEKLEPASSYKFRVSAINSQGCSKPSEVASFSTLAAAPGPPQKARIQGNPLAFNFNAEWDVPANTGGGAVNSYVAEVVENLGTDYRSVYRGEERKCTVSSLTPGQKYFLRVAACSEEGGQGEWCKPISVKLPATVPGSPGTPYVSGRPKSSSMLLSWAAPEFTGGADITSYVLEVAGDGSSEFRAVYDGPRTSHNVATLQPGKTYKFRVRASNSVGKGMHSAVLEASTGAAPPGSPADVTCTGLSSSSVRVTWQTAPTHGTAVREYIVEMAQDANNFTQVYRGKERVCEVRSLKPAADYSFRVAALSDSGQGSWSLLGTGKTLPGPPAAVTGLSLVKATSDELTVSWAAPHEHGSPITHYHVELVGSKQTVDDESSNRATITDLRASTSYRIRVQAVNRIGSGPFSSVLNASTRAARPQPPSLELAGRYHNALKVRWTARQGCDYNLQVASSNSFETVYSGSATSHKVSQLDPTVTYRLRVRAENDVGASDYCSPQSFQTTELPPQPHKDIKFESVQEESANITWPALNAKSYSPDCQVEIQCMEDGNEYRTVFVGDRSSTSFRLAGLRPGVKFSVRCRVKEPSSIADTGSLYSSFTRAVTFSTPSTTVASTAASTVAGSENGDDENPERTSPAASSTSLSSSAANRGKHQQRGKRPPKTSPQIKPAVMPNDQQQAVLIMVAFGVVAVLVAVAASLYLVG